MLITDQNLLATDSIIINNRKNSSFTVESSYEFKDHSFVKNNPIYKRVFEFIDNHIPLHPETSFITSNLKSFPLKQNNSLEYSSIINLGRINDIRYINKFFEEINDQLPIKGKFVCCVKSFQDIEKNIRIKKIPVLGFIFSLFLFTFKRFFPKVKVLKKIYFSFTKGENRFLSKSEALGRLISCGFDIIDYKKINGLIYIISVKNRKPKFDMNPSYGPIYTMPRVGKNKKIINVYKIRTMHPYSEYLQSYMYQKNGTTNGDKINDDFRVSKIGNMLRKLWIDELPMVLNLIKGDIKLVGVRPLSKVKFKMYPTYAQEARVKSKPGLVPPFYVDLPDSFEGLVDSEMLYLERHKKSPTLTDINYFFVV